MEKNICMLDELGRAIISKEIREALGWEAKDKLTITVDKESGKLILELLEKGEEA